MNAGRSENTNSDILRTGHLGSQFRIVKHGIILIVIVRHYPVHIDWYKLAWNRWKSSLVMIGSDRRRQAIDTVYCKPYVVILFSCPPLYQ
jgi:hypothetical protein